MEPRIIEDKAFRLVGKGIRVSMTGTSLLEIPKFWENSIKDGTYESIVKLASDGTCLGASADFNPADSSFTYLIACRSTEANIPEGFSAIDVPALTWAIFEAVGPLPKSIKDLFCRIYSEYLPTSRYKHANGPDIEVYLPGDTDSHDYKCEVWIPVE